MAYVQAAGEMAGVTVMWSIGSVQSAGATVRAGWNGEFADINAKMAAVLLLGNLRISSAAVMVSVGAVPWGGVTSVNNC